MNKLIISEDVERALETFMDYDGDLEFFVQQKNDYVEEYEPLNRFTVEQMALLLCGWYEVEKPFKVGDWIYRELSDSYERIIGKDDEGFILKLKQKHIDLEISQRRILPRCFKEWKKVEELWKIALLEAGREKPELVAGDFVLIPGHSWHIDTFNGQQIEGILNAKKEGFIYPKESRINIKGGEGNE